MALTKEDILGLSDVEVKLIEVPQWSDDGHPAEVYIRTLSGAERCKIADLSKKSYRELLIGSVIYLLSDEHGKQLFSHGDSQALGNRNGIALQAIFDAGFKFNDISEEAVEEAEKN